MDTTTIRESAQIAAAFPEAASRDVPTVSRACSNCGAVSYSYDAQKTWYCMDRDCDAYAARNPPQS